MQVLHHVTDHKRSMTAVVALLGSTAIKTHCKRQHTVETSTYGAEIVALRIGVEIALELTLQAQNDGHQIQPSDKCLV